MITRTTFEQEALVHLDALFRVARRFVADPADAEDLVQDTMFKAYQAWDQYEPGTNAKGWLLAILRNTFINEYRREARRRTLLRAQDLGPAPADPERAFWDGVVDQEVVRAIESLAPQFREILVLCDIEGLRYEEIAAAVGVPVGTVKSRLFRARRELQERLYHYALSTGWIHPRSAPAAASA